MIRVYICLLENEKHIIVKHSNRELDEYMLSNLQLATLMSMPKVNQNSIVKKRQDISPKIPRFEQSSLMVFMHEE